VGWWSLRTKAPRTVEESSSPLLPGADDYFTMRNGILDVLVVLQPDDEPAMAVIGDAVAAVLQLEPGMDPCSVRMPPAGVFFSDRTGPLWDVFVMLDVPSVAERGVRAGFDSLCQIGHPFVVIAVRDPETWHLDGETRQLDDHPALTVMHHLGNEIVVVDPGQAGSQLRDLVARAVHHAVARSYSSASD
jgi:hypothetical protein